MLNTYDPSLDLLQDYAEIATDFGYVTLFVAACPVAPLIAYISNLIEIRTEGWKLLYHTRRVVPIGAQDILTWLPIFQILAFTAVVTNAGLLCFTMQLLKFSNVGKIWIFIGFQYVVFVSMAVFAAVVDDVTAETSIQLERQEYLNELVSLLL